MGLPFSMGSEVSCAGARWRVARVLGVEAVLLCSDTGDEVAADPLGVTVLDARRWDTRTQGSSTRHRRRAMGQSDDRVCRQAATGSNTGAR
jgi:hypothetical protein